MAHPPGGVVAAVATNQETFDKIVRGIRLQGGPSVKPDVDGRPVCKYRGAGGRKCAAGHVIPDGKYDPDMEGAVLMTMSGGYSLRASVIANIITGEGHNTAFVEEMQILHDECAAHAAARIRRGEGPRDDSALVDAEFRELFKERALTFAVKRGLDTSGIDAPKYTKQETFDHVVRSLILQGKPARDAEGHCQYRTPDGLKCGAGYCIPDDKYDPAYEGTTLVCATHTAEHSKTARALLDGLKGHDLGLLRDLQNTHDGAQREPELFVADFVQRARGIAEIHGLDASVCDFGGAA